MSFLSSIGAIILFIIKATLTGIGLGFGFFVAGYVTENLKYYGEHYMMGKLDEYVKNQDGSLRDYTYRQQLHKEWWYQPALWAQKRVDQIAWNLQLY